MESFEFKEEWMDMFNKMPADVAGKCILAIAKYAFTGRLPEEIMISALTMAMRCDIDRQQTQANEISLKRTKAINARWNKKYGIRPELTKLLDKNEQNDELTFH